MQRINIRFNSLRCIDPVNAPVEDSIARGRGRGRVEEEIEVKSYEG